MVSLNKRTVSNCLTPTRTGQRQKERLLRGHSPGHGLLRKCHKLRLCQSLGTYLDAGESLSLHAVGPGTLEQTQSLSNLDLPSYENIFPRDISLVLLHPGSEVQDLVLSHGFSSDGLLFPGVVSTAAFPNMDSSTLDDSTNSYEILSQNQNMVRHMGENTCSTSQDFSVDFGHSQNHSVTTSIASKSEGFVDFLLPSYYYSQREPQNQTSSSFEDT
jgi:hypothetical protein